MCRFLPFLAAVLFVSRAFCSDGAQIAHPDLYLDADRLAQREAAWLAVRGARLAKPRYSPALVEANLARALPFHPSDFGPRQALKNWLLDQKDSSVAPHQLFEKGVELCGGDVLEGLTTTYDVLRDGWRRVPARNTFEHILKLRDITGERDVFNGNFATSHEYETTRGDNFSAWYHFFGAAIYSLSRSSQTGSLRAELRGRAAVFVEDTFFSDKFFDGQKRFLIDRAGVRFGARLARELDREGAGNPILRQVRASDAPTDYLYDAPDVYGPAWHLKPGQSAGDYGTANRTRAGPTLMEAVRKVRALRGRNDSASLEQLDGWMQHRFPTSSSTAPASGFLEVSDVQELVQQQVIFALGTRTDTASLERLRSFVKERRAPSRRAAALLALAKRAPSDLDELLRSAAVEAINDPELRNSRVFVRTIVELLGSATPTPERQRFLAEILREAPVPEIRAMAAQALLAQSGSLRAPLRAEAIAARDSYTASELAAANGTVAKAKLMIPTATVLAFAGGAAGLGGGWLASHLIRAQLNVSRGKGLCRRAYGQLSGSSDESPGMEFTAGDGSRLAVGLHRSSMGYRYSYYLRVIRPRSHGGSFNTFYLNDGQIEGGEGLSLRSERALLSLLEEALRAKDAGRGVIPDLESKIGAIFGDRGAVRRD